MRRYYHTRMFSGSLFSLRLLAVLLFMSGVLSCKKFVEVSPPDNILTTRLVFSDDQSATLSVTGLYSRMMSANLIFLNGAMSLYPALSADELSRTTPNPETDAFFNNAISSSNRIIANDIWKNAYSYIYQTNACIEGISASTAISPGVRNQLIGEMKFMRAFCYFYLVNIFGDVPLETTTNYQVNASTPRTSEASVYNQITNDLKDAENLLQPAYPDTGRIRPNRWAATALLARTYLYQRNWSQAETSATAVINNAVSYSLASINNVFVANSPEVILQFYPVQPNFNTAEGNIFLPPPSSSIKPVNRLTDYLINSFEPGDQRLGSWTGMRSIGGQPYYYPAKYKVKLADASGKTEYNIALRLAELYLIRAEAKAQQNNIASGVVDLDMIRTRAGLPPSPASTATELLLAVEHERQVELFAEWGHRWFDLKRTGRADAVLGMRKPSWQPAAKLYPIPQTEIQSNPGLIQNPGYQ